MWVDVSMPNLTKQALSDHLHEHMKYQHTDTLQRVASLVYDGLDQKSCSLTLVGPTGSGKSMTTHHLKRFFGDDAEIVVVSVASIRKESDMSNLIETLPKQLLEAASMKPRLIILSVDDVDTGPSDILQYIAILIESSPLLLTETTLLTVFTCSRPYKEQDECVTRALGHIVHYATPTYINKSIFIDVSQWK